MSLVAAPVYTEVRKGPRAGAKIINWAATADKYEELFKESMLHHDHLEAEIKHLKSSLATQGRTLDSMHTEQDKFRSQLRAMASHWTSMFWPKSWWDAIRTCGVNV